MKRIGNLYKETYSARTMDRVFHGVMKDKRGKNEPGSLPFMIMNNPEYYKAEAARILENREFKPKRPRESIRYDAGSNKERHIQAPALFPDQFIHWALILVLEDTFMRGMDDWCCASVKGRGTLYAKSLLDRTLDNSLSSEQRPSQRVENKYKYCLKMDIRKYFQNVDRDILMKKLKAKIKDPEIIHLIEQIVYSVPGTGIPLGYYTSQWFANFYLQSFDHYLREVLMPRYHVSIYVRYMDDMVILGSNKRELQRLKAEIEDYLMKELHVWLKHTSCIFAIADRPIDFVGYRFSYGKTVLRKGLLHSARRANRNLYRGRYTLSKARSALAYNGWIQNTDTKEYRDNYFKGSLYQDIRILRTLEDRERERYLSSEEYAELMKLKADIAKLREETELGDGHVLIRYYPDTGKIKVVARTRYRYYDQDEYEEEIRKANEAKANKKKKKRKNKHKKGEPYRAPAERYFVENGKSEVYARAYNQDINDYDAYRYRQFTKGDWYNTK